MDVTLKKILPLVTKPIRYTGGEYNLYIKNPENQPIYFGLIMPEVYEIGMSNYGLKILYSILNRQKNVIAERTYAPWLDFGEKLKEHNVPLYSLESKRPLKKFDILGFSLQSELSYTNVLYILDLSGIPLLAKDRNEKDPLIIAGGPCCVNPLPIQDFFDCFVIGDGEEVILEIVDVYENWNRRHRADLLKMLSQIEGIYVPLINNRNKIIKRRVISSLKEEDFPYPPIVPICEIVHDRLTIEIARGCSRGCRFCQAGIINRPVRRRMIPEILRLAERGMRSTGWEEVSLLSLSASDYPDLEELVTQLCRQTVKRKVAISLPSMRGEDLNEQLLKSILAIKKTGLTFAPETCNARLQSLINKDIAQENIFHSIALASSAGWRSIKLYFMIGLPGEDFTDLDAIALLVNTAAKIAKHSMIKLSINQFIPKPHTPLQWTEFEKPKSIKEKIAYLRQQLKHRRNIIPKWENVDVSYIQAILARGDEKLNPVVLEVYKNNGVFQDWTEKFNVEVWQKSFEQHQIDVSNYLRAKQLAEPLPWDFIDVGIEKTFLKNEYLKALNYEKTPDCRIECQQCGIKNCDMAKISCSSNLNKEKKTAIQVNIYSNPEKTFKQNDTGHSDTIENQQKSVTTNWQLPRLEHNDFMSYPTRNGELNLNVKVRFKYTVGESFRFAGHLDIVRAIYRALRRSELPIAFSKGYSPHPLVSFGPPLPVGVISHSEYFDIEMTRYYSGNIVRDLGIFFPKDIRIVDARLISRRTPSLGKSCNLIHYMITDIPWDFDIEMLENRKATINGIENILISPPKSLQLFISIGPKIKLYSILQELFLQDETKVRQLNVIRQEIYMVKNGKRFTPMEITENF
ncbi:MAG: TIGR03960 family B12-binding radical SAM protein [candidate division WOR-3 bacterium]|nr:TIGR03960 family B12-binding radical SAM protein [candidate division WOR-3 bacterium]